MFFKSKSKKLTHSLRQKQIYIKIYTFCLSACLFVPACLSAFQDKWYYRKKKVASPQEMNTENFSKVQITKTNQFKYEQEIILQLSSAASLEAFKVY